MRESLRKVYQKCSKTKPWSCALGCKKEGKRLGHRMVRSFLKRELEKEVSNAS